jgi:hypothetical protein
MSDFRADLHCHSFYSDGEDAPFDLLAKAKAAQLSGLSITDHDTVEAYSPELFDEAKRLGIRLLAGIEVSSELYGASVHILGYGFDLNHPALHAFLKEMIERRRTRNLAILAKLKTKKIAIEEEELISFILKHSKHPGRNRTIGRPHIAQYLLHKGVVSTTQEAFEKYLKEGASCYASGIKFHPKEAIEIIQLAGGKAVLAHPHFMQGGHFRKEILALPLDGIECYYGNLSKELERPWVALAQERGWIATGGSDYHGSFKPHISLGCSWVGEATFNKLSEIAN